eukprot:TRINITY_DN58279_c0_g1_i1.p2 TRINITY_DN58279_c0_g1~~TRINITY_DN58279_c0_g1_i1.p2  ORF type:complete len:100 (+),score=0.49 TRINITY_DN58279_c0_g1_i1:43-342(+)
MGRLNGTLRGLCIHKRDVRVHPQNRRLKEQTSCQQLRGLGLPWVPDLYTHQNSDNLKREKKHKRVVVLVQGTEHHQGTYPQPQVLVPLRAHAAQQTTQE